MGCKLSKAFDRLFVFLETRDPVNRLEPGPPDRSLVIELSGYLGHNLLGYIDMDHGQVWYMYVSMVTKGIPWCHRRLQSVFCDRKS